MFQVRHVAVNAQMITVYASWDFQPEHGPLKAEISIEIKPIRT